VLEEPAEQQDLYEKLDELTQEAFENDDASKGRQELKTRIAQVSQQLQTREKIQQYMLNQLRKDASKWKDSLEKQRKLEAELSSIKDAAEKECDQCEMRAEVQVDQENAIREKENETRLANSMVKKLEKDLEAKKNQHKTSMDSIYDTLGNLTKINNDLKAELSKKKTYIETMEKDNSQDIVTTVEVHSHEPEQRVNMSKESTERRCNACDRVFKTDSDLDRHIKDKHTESECAMCNKKFTSAKQADNHICMEGEIVPQTCDKSYCKKEFVSSAALAKHKKNSHFGSQRSVCQECGELLSNSDLMKHRKICNRVMGEQEHVKEKSKVVCKHWRRGKCDRGSQCGFSHVGRQDNVSSEARATKQADACHNGPTCSFLARGKCRFAHHMDRDHQDRGTNQSRGQPGQGRRHQDTRGKCKFGRNCDRVPNCPWFHSLEDFPQYNKNHGFRGTKKSGNQSRS
jgi:hypothetical protein